MKRTNASEDEIVSLLREHLQQLSPRDQITLTVTPTQESESGAARKYDASISVIRILAGKPMWTAGLTPETPEPEQQ